ncbi:MAG: hypothetical protein HFG29_10785 [Eubacterium sp.]|nr:hypothetical protein [Eubacterium sp.]
MRDALGQKWKKFSLRYCFVLALCFVLAYDVEASAIESSLAHTLPKYPSNGQTYWIAFREGFRNDRVELTTCNISGDAGKAYIKWNKSLILQGKSASGRYNQYKLSETGSWEQIGSYVRFTDYATSIIASNLDVYDSQGNLILAKSNLNGYPKYYSKVNISKAKAATISKQYYTGKAIKPLPKLTYKGKYLYKGIDYTLSYKNNKKVGDATIIIKGKGNYKGTKAVIFKIVKKPKGSIKLSKNSATLSLAGVRTCTIKATRNKISSSIKWKSSNTNVATVKNGKITAKGIGTAKITASAGGITSTCKVTVKDTAEKTVDLSFKTFDDWTKEIKKKETSLIFGGTTGINADGSTYYTGNIIVKRQILSYKKIKTKVSLNTPGYYKTIYLKLPNKVKYTLHRHNLKNDLSESSVGRIMVGLVEKQFVWKQKCGCGYENKLTWVIPLEVPEKLTNGETYVVHTNSLVID